MDPTQDPTTLPQRLAANIAAADARRALADPAALAAETAQVTEDLERLLRADSLPGLPPDCRSVIDLLENPPPQRLHDENVLNIPVVLAAAIAAADLRNEASSGRGGQDPIAAAATPAVPPGSVNEGPPAQDGGAVESKRKRDRLRGAVRKVMVQLKFRRRAKKDGN